MMKTLLLVLPVLAALCSSAYAEAVQRMFIPKAEQVEVMMSLRKITFPRIDFQDSKLTMATEVLLMRNNEIERINSPHRFTFVIKDHHLRESKISLVGRDLSLDQVLVQMADLANFVVFINKRAIELYPGDQLPPDLLRDLESNEAKDPPRLIIPPEEYHLVIEKMKKIRYHRIDLKDATLYDAIDLLRMRQGDGPSELGSAFRFLIIDPELRDRKLDLSERDISSDELLIRYAEMTGAVLFIHGGYAEFHKGETLEPDRFPLTGEAANLANSIQLQILERVAPRRTLGEAVNLLNAAAQVSGRGDHVPQIVLGPEVDAAVLMDDFRFRSDSLRDSARLAALLSGHRLVADGRNLKIVKASAK